MSEQTKEVEDMKEFMTVLMEVKVSLADQNAKLDYLLETKPKIESAYETANAADYRSKENEKDVGNLQDKVSKKANKTDIERVVEEKENKQRNAPVWVTAAIAIVALILPFLNM